MRIHKANVLDAVCWSGAAVALLILADRHTLQNMGVGLALYVVAQTFDLVW